MRWKSKNLNEIYSSLRQNNDHNNTPHEDQFSFVKVMTIWKVLRTIYGKVNYTLLLSFYSISKLLIFTTALMYIYNSISKARVTSSSSSLAHFIPFHLTYDKWIQLNVPTFIFIMLSMFHSISFYNPFCFISFRFCFCFAFAVAAFEILVRRSSFSLFSLHTFVRTKSLELFVAAFWSANAHFIEINSVLTSRHLPGYWLLVTGNW